MPARRRPSSSNPLPKILIAVLVVCVFGILLYGFASSAGWFAAEQTPVSSKPSREGRVPVPRSLVGLKAFEKVKREDVFDRELGDDSYFWLPKATVDQHPEWVTSVDQIVNRVMARDKGTDFVFKKSDFLPEGSRTGITAGVPPGKQGFFLDVEKIPGLRFLKQGDYFDLLASLPEESQDGTTEYGLLMGGIKVRGNKPIPINGIRVLVKGGQMIALTTHRSMTTQGGLELVTTDENGREIRNQRQERVAIAIDPQEAVPLTQALGDDLKIHMIAQSGQQSEPGLTKNELDGLVPFPANAVEIKAFSTITAQDLAEPLSGELRRYFFKPGDTLNSWIPKVDDLIGKVVSRDIEPGYIFSESDFLEDGCLIQPIKAFQTISIKDLVGRGNTELVGAVAARDLEAGLKVTSKDVLPAGSLIQAVKANQLLTPTDLVGGRDSQWVGSYVTRSLEPGHQITPQDLMAANSAFQEISPFQQIAMGDLVDGNQSPWVGRIAARKIAAGQEIDENLLLPKGARAGISGGIPKGSMAISVEMNEVLGMDELSIGDEIDLIESSIVNFRDSLSGVSISEGLLASLGQQAYSQVLASGVKVVHRVEDQVTLAVRTDEVSQLVKSLAKKSEIIAVVRPDSSITQGGTEQDSQADSNPLTKIQSDRHPLNNIVITELIVGGKKSAQAFQRSSDE